MLTKTCSKCGLIKEIGQFNGAKRGLHGRRGECKECQGGYNSDYSKNRLANDSEFRAKKNAQSIKWDKENPEKRHEIAIRRNNRDKAQHPEKISARALVNQRVRFGRIPRASTLTCSCGAPAAHYHHYLGYDFDHRYDVTPVCVACHENLQ